jgi:trigger factor
MEISVNKIDNANAQISATITADEIQANSDKIAKQLSKTANVQGFRKGKVPVAIIKKMYGEKIEQDAESEALRTVFNEGLKELGIENDKIMGEPAITKFDKKENGDIEVEVKVAIRPEIDLGDYKNLVEEFEKPTVSDEEVEEKLKEIAEQNAELVELPKNRIAKEGHTVNIDFEGFLDGEPFEGGKAEGFDLQLGSGQFIPGFEEQILGMKKGEEKTITVTFPEDYGSEKLAGKETQFKIKLNAIKEKGEAKLDDELAKKLLPGQEDATLEKLKEQLKAQLESEALMKLYNEGKKSELLEKLVENIDFDLPEFVVEQEVDLAVNNAARDMKEEEIKELRENPEKLEEFRNQFREDAKKSVKATFIIDALAKAEGVEVGEQEVLQTIYMEALQAGQDPQKVYEQYQKSGYIPAIQMAMVEDKVLTSLLNEKMKEA